MMIYDVMTTSFIIIKASFIIIIIITDNEINVMT
jgi:hypothetical protein